MRHARKETSFGPGHLHDPLSFLTAYTKIMHLLCDGKRKKDGKSQKHRIGIFQHYNQVDQDQLNNAACEESYKAYGGK